MVEKLIGEESGPHKRAKRSDRDSNSLDLRDGGLLHSGGLSLPSPPKGWMFDVELGTGRASQ